MSPRELCAHSARAEGYLSRLSAHKFSPCLDPVQRERERERLAEEKSPSSALRKRGKRKSFVRSFRRKAFSPRTPPRSAVLSPTDAHNCVHNNALTRLSLTIIVAPPVEKMHLPRGEMQPCLFRELICAEIACPQIWLSVANAISESVLNDTDRQTVSMQQITRSLSLSLSLSRLLLLLLSFSLCLSRRTAAAQRATVQR